MQIEAENTSEWDTNKTTFGDKTNVIYCNICIKILM